MRTILLLKMGGISMAYLQYPYIFYGQIYIEKYKNAVVSNWDTSLTGVLKVLTHALQSM